MKSAETEAIFACRPNLLVSDLGAGARFYSQELGFRIGWRWSDRQARFLDDREQMEPGEPGTALVERDRAHIILTQTGGGEGGGGGHITWLHFDVHTAAQVDRLFQEWTGRGVRIAEPPSVRAWGMYEMRVHDPDRNVLRVSSPPAGAS